MRITFLGCGPSSGVPSVGHGWGACDPANPRNRRTRPSVMVARGDTRLLVDTSPDLRQQLLAVGQARFDAVLYTHYHADHLHGIDDLRPVNRIMNAPLDAYADAATLAVIRERFGYAFEPLAEGATLYYKPTLTPHEVRNGQPFRVGGIEVMPFLMDHGHCESVGYRFGTTMAYTTDVTRLPEHAFDLLAGVKVWIIGVLVDHEHPTHADVDKALGWLERVGAERGYFTHLGLGLDYDALCARLPDHVRPAHDGLEVDDGEAEVEVT